MVRIRSEKNTWIWTSYYGTRRGINVCFFKAKEISVFLSPEDIEEKLRKLSSSKRFLCKITADSFFIRISSKRPSLFKTDVQAIFRGEISNNDNGERRITYRVEPPLVFWLFSSFFILALDFSVKVFRVLREGGQLDYNGLFLSIVLMLSFEFFDFAESLSQAKMSEERFLKAFKQQVARQSR